MKFGEHVMSDSAVACPQSHNDHVVFSRKDVRVACILSVVIRMFLRVLLSGMSILKLILEKLSSFDLPGCRPQRILQRMQEKGYRKKILLKVS